MAAVPTLVVGLVLWTAIASVAGVIVGQALRRLEPIPVRTRSRRSR